MAYVEHGMWEVLDILRRFQRGESQRHISAATGRSRRTVGRYTARAVELGWDTKVPPTEELAAALVARSQPGPAKVASKSSDLLTEHSAQITTWLAPHDGYRRGLKLTKIHKLLERKGVVVSYWTLRRFAHKELGYGRKSSTVRVAESPAGEVAEVDFGRLGRVYDPISDSIRYLHALIVTLTFSRHQYVHVTHSQKLDDVIDGLEDAWDFFGGVPKRVVIDNMKAAVTRSDRYEPTFQRTFNEYAEHRGFIIDATVARHPKGKPQVERQVQYVRDNFFRGEQWLGSEHVQREARRWCETTAGLRIHGTTRQQPLKQFESVEKATLTPLEGLRFETPHWAEPKVHPDQHVRFQHALYSVPHQHEDVFTKGKQVTVRGDKRLVRIYFRGSLIKTHARKPKGGRSTDYADYPPEKTPYAMRDAEHIIAKAKAHGESIGGLAKQLLSGTIPWSNLRQSQRLLRLVDKYGAGRVDDACRRALGFDLISVKRVERIIVNAITGPMPTVDKSRDGSNVINLPLKFLRPAQSLIHQPTKENENGSTTLTEDCPQAPALERDTTHTD